MKKKNAHVAILNFAVIHACNEMCTSHVTTEKMLPHFGLSSGHVIFVVPNIPQIIICKMRRAPVLNTDSWHLRDSI